MAYKQTSRQERRGRGTQPGVYTASQGERERERVSWTAYSEDGQQPNRQTDTLTDTPIDRQADRQAGRQTDTGS